MSCQLRDDDRCIAIIASGPNQGQRCPHPFKHVVGDVRVCGKHKGYLTPQPVARSNSAASQSTIPHPSTGGSPPLHAPPSSVYTPLSSPLHDTPQHDTVPVVRNVGHLIDHEIRHVGDRPGSTSTSRQSPGRDNMRLDRKPVEDMTEKERKAEKLKLAEEIKLLTERLSQL